jgi:predicted RNase H-like HicB family nuclease
VTKEGEEMRQRIVVRAEIFREGDLYVGLCPDLDVSSFGETIEEARKSLREALEAFLEECERMDSLTAILEEAGFAHSDANWLPRQPIAAELVPVI